MYKYQVVNPPPPDEVICPVCRDIFEEPYQIFDCNHLICKECGDKLKQGNTTARCPKCRLEISQMLPDGNFKRNTLNKLLILCTQGCDKEIELGELKNHLQDCTHVQVKCEFSHVGCQEKVRRCDLAQHLSDNGIQHSALSSKMICLVLDEVRELREENKKLKELVSNIHDKVCSEAVPTFIMEQYAQKKVSKDQWFSPAYFTQHTNGYRMCFEVDFDDDDDELYIYSCVMKGPYDDHLQWPFKGKVIIRLLNQLGDHHHCDFVFDYKDSDDKGKRVDSGERGESYILSMNCLSIRQLDYKTDTNCRYLKDDCLKFKVVVPSLQ